MYSDMHWRAPSLDRAHQLVAAVNVLAARFPNFDRDTVAVVVASARVKSELSDGGNWIEAAAARLQEMQAGSAELA